MHLLVVKLVETLRMLSLAELEPVPPEWKSLDRTQLVQGVE